jgi:hypothetical protein
MGPVSIIAALLLGFAAAFVLAFGTLRALFVAVAATVHADEHRPGGDRDRHLPISVS